MKISLGLLATTGLCIAISSLPLPAESTAEQTPPVLSHGAAEQSEAKAPSHYAQSVQHLVADYEAKRSALQQERATILSGLPAHATRQQKVQFKQQIAPALAANHQASVALDKQLHSDLDILRKSQNQPIPEKLPSDKDQK